MGRTQSDLKANKLHSEGLLLFAEETKTVEFERTFKGTMQDSEQRL
jgi:hypothetical protein